MIGFDNGEKKENGQYERYQTLPGIEGVKVPPLRRTYTHGRCGGVATKVSESIAQTYMVNPTFYSSTFCVGCSDHFPVGEFRWEDGEVVGSVWVAPLPPPVREMRQVTEQELYTYTSQEQQEQHMTRMIENGWRIDVAPGTLLKTLYLKETKV